MTGYVVLHFGGVATWTYVANVKAHSADAAIREVAEKGHLSAEQEGGTYVAVPARSWKPVHLVAETKRHFTLSPARMKEEGPA